MDKNMLHNKIMNETMNVLRMKSFKRILHKTLNVWIVINIKLEMKQRFTEILWATLVIFFCWASTQFGAMVSDIGF